MRVCPKCQTSYPDSSLFCPMDGTALPPASAVAEGEIVDPRVGTVVDRYRLLSKLGGGGMGAVYRAEHAHLGRPVALKLLHPHLTSQRDVVERFFREARSASEVASEHIVQVTDFGTAADGVNFLVMELLSGESLKEAMDRDRPFTIPRAMQIGIQIAEALSAAHKKGVVHRDLKPANIVLEKRPQNPDFVKVLDFGIAKLTERGPGAATLTQTGVVMGTPAYMSPEQASGAKVDARADVYALGIILYEMLVGRPPFVGDVVTQVLLAHVTTMPAPPRTLRPDLPVDLEALVLRCLAKHPAGRPASMEEVAATLQLLLGTGPHVPVQARPQPGAAIDAATITSQPRTMGGPTGPSPLASLPTVDTPIGTSPGVLRTGPGGLPNVAAAAFGAPVDVAATIREPGKGRGQGRWIAVIGIAAGLLVGVGVTFVLIRGSGSGHGDALKTEAAGGGAAVEAKRAAGPTSTEKTASDEKKAAEPGSKAAPAEPEHQPEAKPTKTAAGSEGDDEEGPAVARHGGRHGKTHGASKGGKGSSSEGKKGGVAVAGHEKTAGHGEAPAAKAAAPKATAEADSGRKILVYSDPAGAEILEDGKRIGVAPLPVSTGKRKQLTLRLAKHTSQTVVIEKDAWGQRIVQLFPRTYSGLRAANSASKITRAQYNDEWRKLDEKYYGAREVVKKLYDESKISREEYDRRMSAIEEEFR
jgi:eukaryotic-like serine/threonine-protein kinase